MLGYLRWSFYLRSALFRLFAGARFRRFGKRARIVSPLGIERADRILIGDDVFVAPMGYLAVKPDDESGVGHLEIGAGTKLGRFNHIYATRRVTLGAKVLTANGVYISDNLHRYDDPAVAIMDQPLKQLGEVTIGEGSWIGHNACIVGASLGRNCVVGANAVVTRSAPDHCVLVGAPARIVRRYDPDRGEWRSTLPDGTFA